MQGFHFSHSLWLIIAAVLSAALFAVFLWQLQRLWQSSQKMDGLKVTSVSLRGKTADVLFSPIFARLSRILLVLTILLIGLSLANPRGGYTTLPVAKKSDSIVLLLDISQSMLAQDQKPNRLARAKRELKDLVKGLAGSQFALIVFSGGAALHVPFTRDVKALFEYVEDVHPQMLDWPGTSLERALLKAEELFTAVEASNGDSRKGVFVFSDGESEKNIASTAAVKIAAKLAKQEVQTYCFGFGTEKGAPVPNPDGGFYRGKGGQIAQSVLQFTVLEKLAKAGRGLALKSQPLRGDTRKVITHFQGLGGEGPAVGASDPSDAASTRRVWNELYQWPLALALTLFLLESCLHDFRRRPKQSSDADRVRVLKERAP